MIHMSTIACETIDMSAVLLKAYEIGDMIKNSKEVADYLYWKAEIENDREIQEWIRIFAKAKEKFEECQRFGRFHPDYNEALDEVYRIQERLEQFEAVRQFKRAEQQLDDLLYEVSKTIAHSISEDIKVPSNVPFPAGGCGFGGKCSGKCG